MTTALAVAAPAALVPDLVLPPGFDRIGDTVKVSQVCEPPAPARLYKCSICGSLDHTAPKHPTEAGESVTDLPGRKVGNLSGLDLVPCGRCGLRGHEPGEPGRCLGLDGVGIGQSPWMTGEGQ
jgi:hypothetical protein